MEDEDGVLKEKVTVLHSIAVKFNENLDTRNWSLLPPLRTEAQLLLKELDKHAEWEKKVKRFIQPFLDVCVKIFFEENPEILYDSQTLAQIKLAVADLLQACLILKEHFEMEVDLIKQSNL